MKESFARRCIKDLEQRYGLVEDDCLISIHGLNRALKGNRSNLSWESVSRVLPGCAASEFDVPPFEAFGEDTGILNELYSGFFEKYLQRLRAPHEEKRKQKVARRMMADEDRRSSAVEEQFKERQQMEAYRARRAARKLEK